MLYKTVVELLKICGYCFYSFLFSTVYFIYNCTFGLLWKNSYQPLIIAHNKTCVHTEFKLSSQFYIQATKYTHHTGELEITLISSFSVGKEKELNLRGKMTD